MDNLVHVLDKKYSGDGRVGCPNEGREVRLPQSGYVSDRHGAMTVHGSGAFLICGLCGAQQPVGAVDAG